MYIYIFNQDVKSDEFIKKLLFYLNKRQNNIKHPLKHNRVEEKDPVHFFCLGKYVTRRKTTLAERVSLKTQKKDYLRSSLKCTY